VSAPADGHDLVVEHLSVRYGHVIAVDDISFVVPHGATVALLGANGAGKSSTLAAIAGSSVGSIGGSITLFDEKVKPTSAHSMSRKGVALVPEGRQVFAPLSVEENLQVGGFQHRSRKKLQARMRDVYDMFPVLLDRRDGAAGLLSGGEQQMLAFGRAMMAEPRLILMDEPSMGLAPIMVDRIFGAVRDINERGTSVLLVEQNAAAALDVASHAYVISRGRIVHSGPADEVAHDPAVAAAFLGVGSPDAIAQH
jgi:branched-chain amino acid transport system ATP-binding protein